jgi:hypothetical protein
MCRMSPVPTLLDAFRTSADDSARWAIANAIAFLGFPKTSWNEILAIAADSTFGGGRQNLVLRLHRIKQPGLEKTLWPPASLSPRSAEGARANRETDEDRARTALSAPGFPARILPIFHMA